MLTVIPLIGVNQWINTKTPTPPGTDKHPTITETIPKDLLILLIPTA